MPYSKAFMSNPENRKAVYEKNKIRYEKNKERYNETRRTVYKELGDKYKKSRLNTWKKSGIIINKNTYDDFLNTTHCNLCNIVFCDVGGKTKTNKKCLDHDHLTGHVRCICCYKCNNYLKKYDYQRLKLMSEIHRYHKRKLK